MAAESLWIEHVEVIASQVVVLQIRVLQEMVKDLQERVSHGDDSPFLAATTRQAPVLRLQVRVLFTRRGPSRLAQRPPQPHVPLGGAVSLSLPRRLLVSRADTRPTGQVPG